MGQYYHGTILKRNWKLAKQPIKVALTAWDFDNGAKLMEHSYVGNNYVNAFERLLEDNPQTFAWIGDYADPKQTKAYPQVVYNEYYDNHVGTLDLYEMGANWTKSKIGLTDEILDRVRPNYKHPAYKYYKYAVNLSKKEFVRIPDRVDGEWTIHPLPLLCADGNGRGGGDYHERYPDFVKVGRWAYDRILVTNDEKWLEGLKELNVNFTEDYETEVKPQPIF